MNTIIEIELKLKNHVLDFQNWIKNTFSEKTIEIGNVDDPGYPCWTNIADDIAILFNDYEIRKLSDQGIDNLFYLIGRNWDLGWIIAWLSSNKSLSNIGNLKEDDFYYLCEKSLGIEDSDAQCQFAAAMRKFEVLNPLRERLLLLFFNEKHLYTKRTALNSLSTMKYLHLEDLVAQAWAINDEWVRHTCLETLMANNSKELSKYIKLAQEDGAEILKDLMNRIKL
jgi:hypothetical protein